MENTKNTEKIIGIEKAFFSGLHSEFGKLLNMLSKNNKNIDGKVLFNNLLLINKQIIELENSINHLNNKLRIENIFKNENNDNTIETVNNYSKDIETINKFKPLMIYYRLLLDINKID